MAVRERNVPAFISGTHNLLRDELIPQDAATDSLGWLTRDGRIELFYGRQEQGDVGATGKSLGEHVAFKPNGDAVRFRKVWDNTEGKVQYFDGTDWQNIITGLSNDDVSFSNYSSLAGNFVYITSPNDGLFKIVVASPASYSDVYLSTKNFKGYSIIDKGRMFLWGTLTDRTGLYGSYIDSQDSDVYTTVSAETIGSGDGATLVFSGTLAFKAGGARRTCFGVNVTVTGGEVLTDDYNGNLVGNNGATGTINYTTGAWAITFTTAPADVADNIKATYQWEDSSAKGVTDFSKSATRLAGEGFVVRQDVGGDAIQTIIAFDGSYFSFKQRSVYQFTLDIDDTNPKNEIVRTDVGVDTQKAAVATSAGIVFLNTGNPSRPMMNILQRNPVGDNFTTQPLFPHFDFRKYVYDDVVLTTWDKYVLVACAQVTSQNDRILFCDMMENSVDVAPYGIRAFAKSEGLLYGGDPVSQTTYELLTGFDDMETTVPNQWTGNADLYGTNDLKKVKKLRFKGKIDPNQAVGVYLSTDNGEFQKIGTIRGDADYVDYQSSSAIGTSAIGTGVIGGDDTVLVYDFFMDMKIRWPKFRTRKLRFIAEGFGYVAIEMVTDYDIWLYPGRLPKQYRSKQNVSVDGETFDVDHP